MSEVLYMCNIIYQVLKRNVNKHNNYLDMSFVQHY